MTPLDLFLSFGAAAAAGLLIGLERERSGRPQRRRSSFLGGSRTHPLFALVGAVGALLAEEMGPWPLLASLLALVALLVVSYLDEVRRTDERGITSEAAFLLTFLLGALATSRGVVEPAPLRALTVVALAVVVTLLLSSKPALHPFVRHLDRADVSASLKLLVVAVVVMPLLPDRAMGPLDAVNPRSVGLIVVLIAGVSFVGYAAIRWLGPGRGLGLTGLLGGIASSTAVTLSLSGQARRAPGLSASLALGVMLASAVMFVRVAVLLAVVSPTLLLAAAAPLGAMLAAGLLGSAFLYRASRASSGTPDASVRFSNPLELGRAVKFGLLFTLVLVGSKAASAWLGEGGTYASGVIAGTTDVDAITLSMADLAGGVVALRAAAVTVFLATATNTVTKGVMAAVLGGWSFARRLAPWFGLTVAAGAVALLLLRP